MNAMWLKGMAEVRLSNLGRLSQATKNDQNTLAYYEMLYCEYVLKNNTGLNRKENIYDGASWEFACIVNLLPFSNRRNLLQ